MKANEAIYSNAGHIETGLVEIDSLLGGGIALGKITEFSGSYGVGKSTLALQIIGEAQKKHECLYAENEFQFTPEYAELLGVDTKELDLVQVRIAEEALDAIEEWATTHKNGLIILDSIGGLLPKEESEKSSEGRSIGLQARLIASFCRRMIGILAENKNALVVINHQFTDVGTGRLKSSGGEKLAYHKAFWVTLKPTFGKQSSRATDGSKRNKYIEAELRKEKGMTTTEGKKVSLTLELNRGFVNADEVTVLKRGRPAKTA